LPLLCASILKITNNEFPMLRALEYNLYLKGYGPTDSKVLAPHRANSISVSFSNSLLDESNPKARFQPSALSTKEKRRRIGMATQTVEEKSSFPLGPIFRIRCFFVLSSLILHDSSFLMIEKASSTGKSDCSLSILMCKTVFFITVFCRVLKFVQFYLLHRQRLTIEREYFAI
jgi:hypothetical protein